MVHFPTLGRDGAAYIAQCDCDWRSTNTWSWSEAVAEFETHAENPHGLGTPVAEGVTQEEANVSSSFPPWTRYSVT